MSCCRVPGFGCVDKNSGGRSFSACSKRCQSQRRLWIVASFGHQDQSDVVGLRFLRTAERQDVADLNAEAERRHCRLLHRRRLRPQSHGRAGRQRIDQDPLAHPFGAVAREGVADLVTKHRCQPGSVFGDRE